MKSTKVIYWITTTIIFLWEGVMPALTSHTELAVEGIRHLGYPDYFRIMLTSFKVIGSVALILPNVPSRIKEWAYAGFTFTFISASISHAAVDGLHLHSFFPLFVLVVLMLSYRCFHKLQQERGVTSQLA